MITAKSTEYQIFGPKHQAAANLQRPSIVALSAQQALWASFTVVTQNLANAGVCAAKGLNPKYNSIQTKTVNGEKVFCANIHSPFHN